MTTKTRYRKRFNTGLNQIIIDGKRVTIRPGDFVECEEAAFGSRAGDYELAPLRKGSKKLTPLEAETQRCEDQYRPLSPWLNPKLKPGMGQIFSVPTDEKGLQGVLAEMKSEDFDNGQATGRMAVAKLILKTVWSAWKMAVIGDPMGELLLKEPQGDALIKIADAEARMNVLKAEVSEVNRRIKAAQKVDEVKVDDYAKKMRFAGIAKDSGGKIVLMDGRRVEYRGNKPFFKDDGMSIADYKLLLAKHGKQKVKARQQAEAEAAKKRRQRREGLAA